MGLSSVRKRRREEDEEELLESPASSKKGGGESNEAAFPGAALMDALLTKANKEGITPRELASLLGISAAHLSFLSSGRRRVSKLDDEVLRAAAEFLGKPLVEVDHLAEKRSLEDYYYQADLDQRLDQIRECMKVDPIYGSLCLSNKMWSELPREAKVLIGTMYETHARTNLLPRPKLRPIVHD